MGIMQQVAKVAWRAGTL